MSPTIRHKYEYFHSTVQRAKDRRQKFHFCRLPFDVRPRNVKLNLSTVISYARNQLCFIVIFKIHPCIYVIPKSILFLPLCDCILT